MNDKKLSITITTGTIIKALAVFGIVFFPVFDQRDNDVRLIFSGYRVRSGPGRHLVSKRKIPRILAVIIVYLITFSFFGGMFYLIIPNTFTELTSFANNLPAYLEKPFEAGTVDKIFGNLPSFTRRRSRYFFKQYIRLYQQFFCRFLRYRFRRIWRSNVVCSYNCLVFLSVNAGKRRGKFLKIIIPARHENYAVGLWQRWKRK